MFGKIKYNADRSLQNCLLLFQSPHKLETICIYSTQLQVNLRCGRDAPHIEHQQHLNVHAQGGQGLNSPCSKFGALCGWWLLGYLNLIKTKPCSANHRESIRSLTLQLQMSRVKYPFSFSLTEVVWLNHERGTELNIHRHSTVSLFF